MRKFKRSLALLLAILLCASPALAEVDLADLFSIAGVEMPNYSGSIATLDREVRARYVGSAYNQDGQFRPGALILSLLSGDFLQRKSPNPYAMPDGDAEKLRHMFTSGLLQTSIEGTLTVGDAAYTANFGAGFDHDMCFVVDGSASIPMNFEHESDSFYLRINPYLIDLTRVKRPFATLYAPDAANPMLILQRSIAKHRYVWSDAIDLFFAHLIALPDLAPLLGFLLEGNAAPDDYLFTDADAPLAAAKLLLALAADPAFTNALAQTYLLESVYVSNGELFPTNPSKLTVPQRSAQISAYLSFLAARLFIRSNLPPQYALIPAGLFSVRLDNEQLAVTLRTQPETLNLMWKHDGTWSLDAQTWGSSFSGNGNPTSGILNMPINDIPNTIIYALEANSLDAFAKPDAEGESTPPVHLHADWADRRLNASMSCGDDAPSVSLALIADPNAFSLSAAVFGTNFLLSVEPQPSGHRATLSAATLVLEGSYESTGISDLRYALTLRDTFSESEWLSVSGDAGWLINMQSPNPYSLNLRGEYALSLPNEAPTAGTYTVNLTSEINERKHKEPNFK